MRLEYRFTEANGYLLADVTGEWELQAARGLIDSIAAECRGRNHDRVLADCLHVEVSGFVLDFERFVLGQRVAEKLRHIRMATLFPAEQITKFAESVANQAGATLLVTSNRDEALRWLLEESATGPTGDAA